MKVVVIGGSSQSTPALFAALRSHDEIVGCEFRLIGRSLDRLNANVRAARLLLGAKAVQVPVSADMGKSSLAGAKLVILQIRPGGYVARGFDESFPLRYGICGDEALGPGGLAAAWRSWPILREWLALIADECPNAYILMVSSPVGILTRAANVTFPFLKCMGICELPWTTLSGVAEKVGLPVETMQFAYVGTNHLGWLHGIQSSYRDVVLEYARLRSHSVFPSEGLVYQYRGIPLKYARLHFEAEALLEEQHRGVVLRATVLSGLAESAFPIYQEGGTDAIIATLDRRKSPWYSHAIAPFIIGLCGGSLQVPLFLSIRNGRLRPTYPEDDVLEIVHRFRSGKLFPDEHTLLRASDDIERFVCTFSRYERLAGDAISRRDRTGMMEALAVHPWVPEDKRERVCFDILAGERIGL